MDPFTLMMVLSVAGTGLQLNAQSAAAAQAKADALENERNAGLMAGDAIARGEDDAGMARRKGSSLIGEQRARATAAGIDPSVGTAARLMADTRLLSELDAKRLQNNAAREAWGYKVQGDQFGRQAERIEKRRTQETVGTLLTGAGNAAGLYAKAG